MEGIKLHANWISRSKLIDLACRDSQRFHLRNDPELRNSRKGQHQDDENMADRECLNPPQQCTIVNQRTSEKHDYANESYRVQL